MSTDPVTARILAGRERWVRLDDQREVRIRRPAEARMPALLQGGTLEAYADLVVDWRGPGFTAAGIFGPALGSQDEAVPFGPNAWRELALDNVAWLKTVAEAVQADVLKFIEQREAAKGN
jgi:hypothetical protein